MPRCTARAAIKARGLRAKSFRQLLHAELAPGRAAGPPRSRGHLSRQVATGVRPSQAAGGPGLAVAHRGGAGRGHVARRGPWAGVKQRRQVLRGPRGP